jgi:hypothetical protein
MTDVFSLAVRLTTLSFRLALSAARGTGRILQWLYLRVQQKRGVSTSSVPPPESLWTLLGWLVLSGLVVLLSLLGSLGPGRR